MFKYCALLLISFLFCVNANAQQDTLIRTDSLVDVRPSFNGGEKAFIRFLVKAVRYPGDDRVNGITGKVILSFVIETDGKLTNFEIKSAPSPSLGAEAIRVMKLSPPWVPGTIQNKPVRVRHALPINFSLG
jgi:TonB family protein